MGETPTVEQLHAGEGVEAINRDGTIGHDYVLAIEVGVGDADGSVRLCAHPGRSNAQPIEGTISAKRPARAWSKWLGSIKSHLSLMVFWSSLALLMPGRI